MQGWAYHSKRKEQYIPSLQAGGVSLVYLKYKGGSRGPFIISENKMFPYCSYTISVVLDVAYFAIVKLCTVISMRHISYLHTFCWTIPTTVYILIFL